MEEAIIATLEEFGIHAAGRSTQTQDGESESAEATGVWIGSRKVASIGIGVRQWVSFHGLALNVDADPSAHQGLKPCGFAVGTMTSMEEILGAKLDREAVKTKLVANLLAIFSQY
jgi:lipoyl(octanoyl) transferase